jgi:YYY domain-containing protein
VCALGLGALGFLNTWDFPIYVGLTVLAYAAGRYARVDEPLVEMVQRALVLAVGVTAAGVVLYLPFYIGFSSQAGGLVPYLLPPTRLPQYLVMFGPFVFVAGSFLLVRLVTGGEEARIWGPFAASWAVVAAAPLLLLGLTGVAVTLTEPGRRVVQSLLADPRIQEIVGSAGPGAALRAIVMARLRDPWQFLTVSLLMAGAFVGVLQPWRRRETGAQPGDGGSLMHRGTADGSTQFASLLLLCGLGLTFVVEFVYLRDSFGVRMNTIFKFYYQAWVMLGCASAFGIWWILNGLGDRISGVVRSAFLAGTALLTAGGLVYPVMASYSRVDGFRHHPRLNGAINIAQNHPDDWAAIEWLRKNAEGTPVILEAPGKSYDYEGRISAFTGYPAVLGWALHESQWRGNYDEQGKREPDIAAIYTSRSDEQRLELLRTWEVEYVVVGPPERRYVEELCRASERSCNSTQALRRLDQLLPRAFEQGQTTVYRVPE